MKEIENELIRHTTIPHCNGHKYGHVRMTFGIKFFCTMNYVTMTTTNIQVQIRDGLLDIRVVTSSQ